MELKNRDSKILMLVKRRNLLTVGLSFAILLNLIQAITTATLIDNTRIILVPPTIKEPFWIESHNVSEEYLRQMTDYFLTLILNVTPATASSKAEMILKSVHPESYGLVKEQLLTDETEIKKRQISRFFVPLRYEINSSIRWVKVQGDLTILVGQQPVSLERVQYRLQYQLEGGRLLIESFGEESID